MVIPAEIVIREVALARNVQPAEIFGVDGSRDHNLTRSLAALLLREHSGLSYPQIGRLLKRHHTTIMYGVERVRRLIDSGATLAADHAVAVAGILESGASHETARLTVETKARERLARQLGSLADDLRQLVTAVKRDSTCPHAAQLAIEHAGRAIAATRVAIKRGRR